jgi:transposase-like protein
LLAWQEGKAEKARAHYRCKTCGKTFSAQTGTDV